MAIPLLGCKFAVLANRQEASGAIAQKADDNIGTSTSIPAIR